MSTGNPEEDRPMIETFEALADIAIAELNGGQKLSMVCGPISTGGTGNKVHNFEILNAVRDGLKRRGKTFFNQTPYEPNLHHLAIKWEGEGNTGYCKPILTTFYARIFAAGAVGEAWFIPGWESSHGTCWERDELGKHGCVLHDVTYDELREFLLESHPVEHVELLMGMLKK